MITARGLNSASQIAHGTARMSSFENAHCSSILIFSSILVNHRGFAVVSPWWPALGRHGLAGLAGGVLEGPLDLRKARHRQLEKLLRSAASTALPPIGRRPRTRAAIPPPSRAAGNVLRVCSARLYGSRPHGAYHTSSPAPASLAQRRQR